MTNKIDYNPLAAEYAQHRRINPDVVRRLITRGKINGSSRVLEVGCGTGNYIAAIQMLTGCQAYGCDPSRQMLAEAGRRGQLIELKEGRAESLPYPEASFDMIFSIDVI